MPLYREQPKVFFPWERRRGLRSFFRRARARQIVLAAALLAVFAVLRQNELHASQVRSTRAAITTTIRGIAAWRADHDHGCPTSIDELVSAGYFSEPPRDAWGRALRVTCPGRKDPQGFDVSSDGPDGEPGGLDRVD